MNQFGRIFTTRDINLGIFNKNNFPSYTTNRIVIIRNRATTTTTSVTTADPLNKENSSPFKYLLNQKNEEKFFKNFNEIPKSKGLPIIGNLIDFISAGSAPQLHKYIDGRHKELGDIFYERLGGAQECVFISSARHMRSIFLYEGQYPKHPLPDAWTLYNKKHNCRRGLFFMNGEEWLDNRRIMNRLLLTNNMEWLNDSIEYSTRKLIENWKQTAKYSPLKNNILFNNITNLEFQLYSWSIDVIITIMFGKHFHSLASNNLLESIHEFSLNVHKVFANSSSLMNFPPKIAEIFNLNIWKEFDKNVTNVLKIGNNIIDIALIDMKDEQDGLYFKLKEADMPLDVIKRVFVDLIMAAGDTTAFSAQWALYVLATNTNIQSRVRKEIQNSPDDANFEIPYIKGLIRETLRMYPVAPFIGRFLVSDAIIGNYQIKKNVLVLLSLYTSGRKQEHFPQPMEIQPERWLRNSKGELNNVLHAHGSMPFAMGARSCIGRKIALSQMHSLIAKITSNFELICHNEKKVNTELRLVVVPSEEILLQIKEIDN